MKLVNRNKNTVLAEHVSFLSGTLEKTRGLLSTHFPRAIFFKTRWGIHTIGMRFSIDVVVMDTKYRVRKIKCALVPNKFFFWNPRYYNVLELPEGTIKKSGTEIGDTLAWKEEK